MEEKSQQNIEGTVKNAHEKEFLRNKRMFLLNAESRRKKIEEIKQSKDELEIFRLKRKIMESKVADQKCLRVWVNQKILSEQEAREIENEVDKIEIYLLEELTEEEAKKYEKK